jgi:dopamine beta-monooxygenase
MHYQTMKLLSIIASLMVLFLDVAWAIPSYRSRIPNGFNVVGPDGSSWSAVGHLTPNTGSSINAFGQDFKANGFQWTEALCKMDSDGDGRSNGKELGDPDCVWSEGMEPMFTVNITHPGIFNENFNVAPVNNGGDGGTIETIVLPTWLAAHIACMMLSWGFLLPIGALMAISFRHSFTDKARWFQLHVSIQILGVILNIAGFAIPFINIETHFNGTHQVLGTVVFAMGVAQAVHGFIRPKKTDKPTLIRRVWEVCHKGFGRTVIILAWANSFLGIQLIHKYYDGAPGNEQIMNACKAILGIQIALVVVLTLASFYKSKPQQTNEEKPVVSESEDSINKTTHSSGEMHV